jgi:hypothetical protein
MTEAELLQQVLAAQDWKAFGTGASSHVCRFMLRGAATGGSSTYVQSKAVAGGDQRDYAFYARTNACSAQGFVGALQFCSLVVSHVCSSPAWTKLAGNAVAKVVVPRVLLAFDFGQAGYTTLTAHMGRFQEMLRAVVAAKVPGVPAPQSVAVVEGANCLGILDAQRNNRFPPLQLDMRAHSLELGLLHALDVALGMGDRFQNPNPNNVTVNPTTGQVVIIDLDTFLPPYGLNKALEDLCAFSVTGAEYKRRGHNEIVSEAARAWVACPPRAPFQGDYKRNVTRALERDLKLYTDSVAAVVQREAGSLAGAIMYAIALTQLWKDAFLSAAKLALREIRKGLQDGRFDPGVEDETFSSKRLKAHAQQWSGL